LDKHIFPWQTYFFSGVVSESSCMQVNMVLLRYVTAVQAYPWFRKYCKNEWFSESNFL